MFVFRTLFDFGSSLYYYSFNYNSGFCRVFLPFCYFLFILSSVLVILVHPCLCN